MFILKWKIDATKYKSSEFVDFINFLEFLFYLIEGQQHQEEMELYLWQIYVLTLFKGFHWTLKG